MAADGSEVVEVPEGTEDSANTGSAACADLGGSRAATALANWPKAPGAAPARQAAHQALRQARARAALAASKEALPSASAGPEEAAAAGTNLALSALQ
eukprot:761100-Alexandrium_andersonii.AAC.1